MTKKIKPKNIIFDIGGVLFNYPPDIRVLLAANKTDDIFWPIEHGIKLLRQCHQKLDQTGKKAHNLYVLSNWKTDSFALLTQKFPDIFNLFDGIVISGNVNNIQKPDPALYHHLIEVHALDVLECVFIDDKEENVIAAQTLGMHGIICSDFGHVERQLMLLGVIE